MADVTLEIQSGVKEIELKNAKRGTSVNVLVAIYDVFFIGKILEAGEELDNLKTAMQSAAPGPDAKPADFIRFCKDSAETDRKMREIIDGLFGVRGVCDTLFPDQSMFSVGNGAQTWENLFLAVIDQMDSGLSQEKEIAVSRLKKYSGKYSKK